MGGREHGNTLHREEWPHALFKVMVRPHTSAGLLAEAGALPTERPAAGMAIDQVAAV